MRRSIENELKTWKEAPERYPLLLRGARQVGKTYVIEQLGKSFESFEMVNFEAQPEAVACFETLNPLEIVQKLELFIKRPILPGKTLLFLDEIQTCPQAILALRYFKENMPALHVIGAGSLLDFTLSEGKFSFPVGRVQFLYLYPLSFREFSVAMNATEDLIQIQQSTPQSPPFQQVHERCLHRLKEYFCTGGMPAVIQAFKSTHSLLQHSRIQDLLLATYRADFGKYATEAEQKYLRLLFEHIPAQIGKQFKYSLVDPHIKSRDLKAALDQLHRAGLIHYVVASSASGTPLAVQVKSKKFKALFLDIGLIQRSLQVEPELILDTDLVQVHKGALAEQFTGQELLAYADCFRETKLFFWEREKQSSSAEVDYVISIGQQIIPLEVKAGAQGHLKSLLQFMKEKNSPLGVCLSERPLSRSGNTLFVPLYMIEELPRLIKRELNQDPNRESSAARTR